MNFKQWLRMDETSDMAQLKSGVTEHNEPRQGMKSRWSVKYKRSIDCGSPSGFSQRNYCKRQSRGGKYKGGK